jgi:Carboxypeptidase regulatory-like domain
MRAFRQAFFSAFLVILSFHLSFAQTAQTSLRGAVQDPSGAVIPGAQVTILKADTGFTATRTSDGRGEYNFEQIPPGVYSITGSAAGFGKQEVKLELLVNQPATLDIKMEVTGSTTTVEVSTGPTSLNTTDATIGTPFNNMQIQSLPFEGNNVLDLLSLQAGVLFLGDQSTAQQDQDSRSGAVNGARSDQSNFMLDGLDDNTQSKGYAFTGVLRSTRDSVDEFRVVTTNANADSGRSSGAQVSLVTRAGTNKLHGSLYEYYRPTNTVANDWFNKEAESGQGLPNIPPKFLRHTFGGSVGGAIIKDKLFYFLTYEGQKLAEDSQITNTVPSANLRNGLLSYIDDSGSLTTLNPAQIASMDPYCSANGTCPLGPGVNSAALAYFSQYPAPNISAGGSGDGYNQQQFSFASPAPQSLNTYIAKLDWNIGAKHRLFIRGNLQSDNVLSAEQFPGGPPASQIFSNNKGIAAGDIWSISNTLVNNFRYGFIREGFADRGATNSNFVTFSPISSLTPVDSTSQIVSLPVHNVIDDLTWTKGNHTLQFGGNYRAIFNNRQSDATLYSSANVTYTYLTVGSIAGTGQSLDPGSFGLPNVDQSFYTAYNRAVSDVTGLITHATEYYNYSVAGNALSPLPAGQWTNRHYFSNEVEYYLQDSWKVKPNLTLTAGLRHTLLQVPSERNGQEVRPNVDLGKWFETRASNATQGVTVQPDFSFVPGGRANNAPDLWSMDKFDLAPRISFAYSPNTTGRGFLEKIFGGDGKTAIRGGYGMYYDHFGEGVIDAFDQLGSFGLSTDAENGVDQSVDTAPRFTAFNQPPTSIIPPVASTGVFPVTPGENLALAWGIDSRLKTPYAHVFDLSIEREFAGGNTLQLTYTGRLGRRLLQQSDLATPLNLVDPQGGGDYFAAAAALAKLVDQGVPTSAVPNIKYWDDMFPEAASGCDDGTTNTQCIYESQIAPFRGNETAGLYDLDLGYSPGAPGGATFRYFDPQYASLYAWSSTGTSSYHGLQVSVHHPAAHGLAFDAYYTYSKSLDLASDTERSATAGSSSYGYIINIFHPAGNYGPSDFDVRHSFTGNLDWTLPFGRGRMIGANVNRLTDEFVGGWTLNALMHATSGLPFSAIDGLGWGTDWDVQSYDVATSKISSGGHQVNSQDGQPNAFKNQPAALAAIRPPYPGESGQRNFFRGDGYSSLDAGMAKVFRITEGHQLKFAAEVFNTLNQVKFDPHTVADDPFGGPSSFGDYASPLLTQGRRMQFSLRYSF